MRRLSVILVVVLAAAFHVAAIPPKAAEERRLGPRVEKDVLNLKGCTVVLGSLGASRLMWDSAGGGGGLSVGTDLIYFVSPRLALGGEVGWIDLGDDRYTGDYADEEGVSSSAIPIVARAYLPYPLESGAVPYVSLGAGVYRVSHSGSYGESGLKPGANLGGGVMAGTGGRAFFGVDGMVHSFLDDRETALIVLDFRVRAGVRL